MSTQQKLTRAKLPPSAAKDRKARQPGWLTATGSRSWPPSRAPWP